MRIRKYRRWVRTIVFIGMSAFVAAPIACTQGSSGVAPDVLGAASPPFVQSAPPSRETPPPRRETGARSVPLRRTEARPAWTADGKKACPFRLRKDWVPVTSVTPPTSSRLDYCAEYTKPDSLRIRLMGTPKNHRSPPA